VEPTESIQHVSEPGPALEQIRALFTEYAESLGFDLCFQGFDEELRDLPGMYAPPHGTLLLATVDGKPAGCAGLHPWSRDDAEMKRLYVKPEFRGSGIGRRLAEIVVREAKERGFKRVLLDTIPSKMAAAVALYRSLGFQETLPYRENPINGAVYLSRFI
jgi:ribosomal protein S18 acetylase RimI-like enzyme